jgi:trimeric autotransporter adhesin
MTINRTTLLDLPLPVTGTESGTWGDVTNNGLSQYVDIAVAGMNALTSSDFTAGALTISNTQGDSGGTNIAAGSAQYATIKVSSLATNSTITAPASNRSYRIVNLDSTYNLTIKASGQTGITFLPGQTGVVAFTGTDYEVVGVVNAASSTDNAIPKFDGTTGQIIQNTGVTIDDSNNVSGVAQLNATTADLTNIEVTNIKAKDGTSAGSIADSTGVVTLASSVLTTTDINGGTIDGAVIGGASAAAGSFTTLGASSTATFAAGAVGTPAITTTGDTNTGIFFPAADTIAFSEGGAEAMRIDSDGRALVGLTSWSGDAKLVVGPDTNGSVGRLAIASNTTGDNPLLELFEGTTRRAFLNYDASGNICNLVAEESGSALAFQTAATERMRIDSSGNVGIGTTSPNYALDVVGNIRATNTSGSTIIVNKTSNPGSVELQHSGTQTAQFSAVSGGGVVTYVGSTPVEAMRIDSSGNVGIGTSSPSTYGKLALIDNRANRMAYFYNASTDAAAGGLYVEALPANGATKANWTTGAMLTLSNSNYLSSGIVSKLVLNTSNGGYNNGAIIHVEGAGSYDKGELVFSTGWNISNNATERMRITSGGYFKASNTGSYADSTSTTHEFNNSANAASLRVTSTSATYNGVTIISSAARNTTNASYYHLGCYKAGSNVLLVADSGDVTNINNSYGAISDVKLKQDIVDAASQWDDIKNLRVRKFHWKSDPDGFLQMGLVAQEAELVSPGLIDEHPDYEEVEVPVLDDEGNPVLNEDGTPQVTKERNALGTTTKAIKYSVLYMKAVKALQEAMERIETLEAKVAALEAK